MVIAAGCLTVGLRGNESPLSGPVAQRTPPSTTAAGSTPAVAGGGAPVVADTSLSASAPAPAPTPTLPAVAARSAPVSLSIPAIDLVVSVSALGLNPDRTVEVPTDFQEPGWFELGPSPGQLGSAVILGHVDSYEGPAVFFRLRSLQTGDEIEVSLADGSVVRFAVTTVATYPKEEFPASQVYASQGYSALQLVTCGGAFDSDARSYLSNVVVYTSLVAITPAD